MHITRGTIFRSVDCSRGLQAQFHIIQELLGKVHATVVSTERGQAYKKLMDDLNMHRRHCRDIMRSLFNSSFGATFLTDTGQESAFAYHIHQYADVYTSKPENFMLYTPDAWLHVPCDIKIMPHHVKVTLFDSLVSYKPLFFEILL